MSAKNMIQVLLNRISEGQIEELDLRFTDLLGHWRHVTLPARSAEENLFSRGIGFDGSTLEGMTRTEAGDMILLPDPRRVYEDPFAERPTLSLFCDIVHPATGEPFSRDPRGVARKASEYVKVSEIATETFWAPEFEFYLFDKATFWFAPGKAGFEMESIEAPSRSECAEARGLVHSTGSAYHRMFPVDSLHNVRAEICSRMQSAGIQVKYHHHEVGNMGQVEVEVQFAPLLSSADNVMLTKHIVRNVALKHSLAATFMPKPLHGEAGSGMHFHIYFVSGTERVFYCKDGYCHLSTPALSAIAGILRHAPAIAAFSNASVNSYRRLIPGQEAPVYRFFSGPNRSAAIRVPGYADTPESMRFEYRVPDAAGNPYLSMAAILMAAADGIEKKMDPEKLGFGPVEENVFREGYETSDLARLPASLGEALDELSVDRAFLVKNGVFSDDLIEQYIAIKRAECSLFPGAPHPLEHKLYFNL
ncbi:type I glutamate--ammonia ligase [Candidatus Fermentibacterales bacterium]|nr:type I glutamate--ammonia ligase [Candidatus Fermentibacterales bacterium]